MVSRRLTYPHAPFVAAMLVAAVLPVTLAAIAPGIPSPLVGGSTRGNPTDYVGLKELGSTAARVYAVWSFAQPQITTLDCSLTVASIKADPSIVSTFAATVDWSVIDARMASTVAAGAEPIMDAFEGTTTGMPRFANGTFVSPCSVGKSCYLAWSYLWARAVSERYTPKGVRLWQIENEFNAAWFVSVANSQRPWCGLLDSPWRSWDFLTESLSTIIDAVKDGAGSSPCYVTTNLHTDVNAWVYDALLLKGYYVEAAKDWGPMLDFLSIDVYANYFIAECLADDVGKRVAAVKAAVGNGTMFTMVMETSYPALPSNATNSTIPLPSAADFTAANQAACAADMVDSAFAAGAEGFLWFVVTETPGMSEPAGGFDAEDASALTMMSKLYQDHEDPLIVIEWLVGKGHIKYLESGRLGLILGSLGNGFGLLEMDGTPRPALAALAAAYKKYQ